jgi:hypothetical protein
LAAPIVSIVIISARIASPSRRGRAEPSRDMRAELWRDKRAKSRLMFVSDCNGDLPPKIPASAFLGWASGLSGFCSPASLKPGHHFSAGRRRQLENRRIRI